MLGAGTVVLIEIGRDHEKKFCLTKAMVPAKENIGEPPAKVLVWTKPSSQSWCTAFWQGSQDVSPVISLYYPNGCLSKL